ncbi:hypothetical protein [Nocardioides speluncae]|uniref:hypothetical protein n=1 Tax=Nocardioides speluncae TaxID=2670337 RepID=UPI000D69F75C|nr:hypothetical protein [Nocardioides speluncae]
MGSPLLVLALASCSDDTSSTASPRPSSHHDPATATASATPADSASPTGPTSAPSSTPRTAPPTPSAAGWPCTLAPPAKVAAAFGLPRGTQVRAKAEEPTDVGSTRGVCDYRWPAGQLRLTAIPCTDHVACMSATMVAFAEQHAGQQPAQIRRTCIEGLYADGEAAAAVCGHQIWLSPVPDSATAAALFQTVLDQQEQ